MIGIPRHVVGLLLVQWLSGAGFAACLFLKVLNCHVADLQEVGKCSQCERCREKGGRIGSTGFDRNTPSRVGPRSGSPSCSRRRAVHWLSGAGFAACLCLSFGIGLVVVLSADVDAQKSSARTCHTDPVRMQSARVFAFSMPQTGLRSGESPC